MTEAGPLSLISDEDSDDSDRERSRAIKLPGVTKGILYYTYFCTALPWFQVIEIVLHDAAMVSSRVL